VTVKVSALVAEPVVVSTCTTPLTAPGGIVNVTLVELTLVGTVMRLPILTPTVPASPVPVIVTGVPTGPVPGEIPLIAGGGRTVKVPALVPVPAGPVTAIVPLVAPVEKVNVNRVLDVTVNGTLAPSSFTAVAPVKLAPVTVIVACAPALPGVKLLIVGGVKKRALVVALPPGPVTLTVPVGVPAATVAVIWVSVSTV
jgi:hypothetical protein